MENEEGKFKKEPEKEGLGPEADDKEDTYEEQRDIGGREKSGGGGGSGGSVACAMTISGISVNVLSVKSHRLASRARIKSKNAKNAKYADFLWRHWPAQKARSAMLGISEGEKPARL